MASPFVTSACSVAPIWHNSSHGRIAPTSPRGGDGGAGAAIAELSRLAQLHEFGALTDKEFAVAKAKLLGM